MTTGGVKPLPPLKHRRATRRPRVVPKAIRFLCLASLVLVVLILILILEHEPVEIEELPLANSPDGTWHDPSTDRMSKVRLIIYFLRLTLRPMLITRQSSMSPRNLYTASRVRITLQTTRTLIA